MTGGGIASAMKGGMFAGQVCNEAIDGNNVNIDKLKKYIKLINADFVKRHRKLYNIKEAISRLTDNDYNSIALSISKIPKEKITLAKIFAKAVYKKPSLAFDVMRVLSGY